MASYLFNGSNSRKEDSVADVRERKRKRKRKQGRKAVDEAKRKKEALEQVR
jgi:hypothetical protein